MHSLSFRLLYPQSLSLGAPWACCRRLRGRGLQWIIGYCSGIGRMGAFFSLLAFPLIALNLLTPRRSSFSTFEELTDVIVGVALVRPRPGVFVDSISHLLVLATPSQVTLVGLGYTVPEGGSKKEVTFFLTGLSVPTDGVSFTTIRGTSTGRIFLSSSPDPLTPGGIGGDGCLYELVYQAQEGWFAKRCTLHNLTSGGVAKAVMPSFLRSFSAVKDAEWIVSLEVDNERGLVYSLLRNSTIVMHQLPSTGTGAGQQFDGPPLKVATSGDLVRTANMLLPNNPSVKNFRIVELEVISVKEGGNAKIGLVAVTSTGVRLYFTHQRRGYYYGGSSSAALELCHVRPPPAPSSAPQPPSSNSNGMYGAPQQQQHQQQGQVSPANSIPFTSIIQSKYSSGGLLLASNNLTPDLDILLVCAPDVASSARSIADSSTSPSSASSQPRPFTEVAGTIEIPGRTWDMAEITPASLVTPGGGTALNELATQGTSRRREWVVLTNMGANVVSRQRPVDTLLEVLEGASLAGNGGHGEIGVFFERCVSFFPFFSRNSSSRAQLTPSLQLRPRPVLRHAPLHRRLQLSTPHRRLELHFKLDSERWQKRQLSDCGTGEGLVL